MKVYFYDCKTCGKYCERTEIQEECICAICHGEFCKKCINQIVCLECKEGHDKINPKIPLQVFSSSCGEIEELRKKGYTVLGIKTTVNHETDEVKNYSIMIYNKDD